MYFKIGTAILGDDILYIWRCLDWKDGWIVLEYQVQFKIKVVEARPYIIKIDYNVTIWFGWPRQGSQSDERIVTTSGIQIKREEIPSGGYNIFMV